MKYYRLTDAKNQGTLMRTDKARHEQYIPEKGWKPSGLLLLYFNDESDLYDQYEEISEDAAEKMIAGDEDNSAGVIKKDGSVYGMVDGKPIVIFRRTKRKSASARRKRTRAARSARKVALSK